MKQYSAYSLDRETDGELVYGAKDRRWGVDDGGFREFTSTVVNGKRVYLAEGGWGNMYLTDDQFEILDKYFSGDKYKNYVGDDKDGDDVLKIEEELGAEYDTNLEYNMTNSAGLTSHYYNGGIFCGVCDEGLYKIYRAIKKEREKFNIH